MATSHHGNRISIEITLPARRQSAASGDTTPDADIDVPMDVALDAVRADRRRAAIETLADAPGPVPLDELTDAVAADEYDGEVGSQQRKRVYVSLYQTHVPTLEDLGLIEFDGEDVAQTAALYDVARWLDDSRARFVGGAA